MPVPLRNGEIREFSPIRFCRFRRFCRFNAEVGEIVMEYRRRPEHFQHVLFSS